MAYESFVGQRYLMAKQRSRVVSIITLIAVGGVALGVTALIVVLSVMGGFTQDLTDNILGARAHIVIQDVDQQPLEDADQIADRAEQQHPDIIGAAPFIESEVMVSSRRNLNGVVLRGVDVQRVAGVNNLLDDLEEGALEYLQDDRNLFEREDIDPPSEEILGGEFDELLDKMDEYDDESPGTEPVQMDEADLPDDPHGGDAPPLEELDADDGEDPSSDSAGDEPGEPPPLPQIDDEDDTPRPEPPRFDAPPGDQVPELPELGEPSDPAPQADEPAGEHTDGASQRAGGLPGLIIGTELAHALDVRLGDEVDVVTPRGELGPTGPVPRSRPYRVVGLFHSGMYEYDANHAYAAIEDTARLLDQRGATGVEVRAADVDDSVEIADTLRDEFGSQLDVLDWQELNSSLFFALRLERIAMFVVLTFIILVASFSIIAMLIMIVIEKAREIAIMKSMGASDGGIMRIFIYQGVVIGTVGAVLGLGAGLGICWALQTVGLPLDQEVYYITTLPVEVNPVEVAAVVICAIVISFLATIYPSYKAAQLNPVKGLRYD